MLVVVGTTVLALYVTQRNLVARVEDDLEREFEGELAARDNLQQVRHAALVERCRALVRKPRIHAALEDDALDLLYPNAEDEMRDIMTPRGGAPAASGLHALFYRFLDRNGTVIPAPRPDAVGPLSAAEEAQMALPGAPRSQQIGYLARRQDDGTTTITEIITMPIVSTETGEVIAALALGFRPFAFASRTNTRMRSGIWLKQSAAPVVASGPAASGSEAFQLERNAAPHPTAASVLLVGLDRLPPPAESDLLAGSANGVARPVRVTVDGERHLQFSKPLNAGSAYPPAYEICVYPLGELAVRQRQLRWQILGTGGLLLLVGLGASHFVSLRLSVPVEKLAVDSEENLAQRRRAEAALESTSAELQRSARFSADASHQLKTPVTVLRLGLEELLTRENLTATECNAISALVHQTYRLSTLIEDLLLLSRLDAGRLQLEMARVDLTHLIEASLDDLSALPDELDVAVETDYPPDLHIVGEQRYTAIILQNLLENARKYNRVGGRIRITARRDGASILLAVGNTGHPISPETQAHIFERFHRGAMGENVPGYGLGLNLARELARLHGGDLRLTRSDDVWTEFEVRFRAVAGPRPETPSAILPNST